MDNLSKRQKDLKELAEAGANDSALILYEKYEELEKKVEGITDLITKEPPEDVKIEKIASRLGVKAAIEMAKIEKGDKGDALRYEDLSPEQKQEIASMVEVPIVEKVIERTEVIKEQPIVTEVTKVIKEVKEVAVVPDPEEMAITVVNYIETLEDDDRLDVGKLKGGARITVSINPPPNPKQGDLWIRG